MTAPRRRDPWDAADPPVPLHQRPPLPPDVEDRARTLVPTALRSALTGQPDSSISTVINEVTATEFATPEAIRRIVGWHHTRVPDGTSADAFRFASARDAVNLLRALGYDMRRVHEIFESVTADDAFRDGGRRKTLPSDFFTRLAAVATHGPTDNDLTFAFTHFEWTFEQFHEVLDGLPAGMFAVCRRAGMSAEEIMNAATTRVLDVEAVQTMAALHP